MINYWIQLTDSFSIERALSKTIYNTIIKKYNEAHRYYHNLNHIKHLLGLFNTYQSEIINKEIILFSIWFHDVIYDPKRKDNEEKSADFTNKVLSNLTINKILIKEITNNIISTKNHIDSNIRNNSDLAYFLDFDLAILASDYNEYLIYSENIRKEYFHITDNQYLLGRINVLNHFLKKDLLFKTKTFNHKYNKKAHKNINKELDILKNKAEIYGLKYQL